MNLVKSFGREKTLHTIVELLKKKDFSIADLSRKLDMKRSTLIYYLEILETRKIIKRKRIETKETGRPTKIIFSKEGYKRWEDKILHEDIGGLKTFVLHIIEVINNGVKLGRIKKNDYEDFKKKVISSFN